jgi:flagellin
MSSILTNVGAMSALQSISSTNRNLATTQNRISTGLRVETAKDNSSSWAIATTMRGDVQGFKAIAENLALSTSTVSVAREGAEAVTGLLNQIKEKVVQASGSGVDTAKIADDIQSLIDQVDSVIDSAQFNGTNLLDSGAAVNLLSSLNRTGTTVAVDTIDTTEVDFTALHTAIDAIDVTTSAATRTAALNTIEAQIVVAVDAAAQFGSVQSRLEIQSDFVSALTDALSAGVGSIVDANMEEEAARLSALQVQQQLGVQSLSIANSAPQSILALFR